QRPRDFHVVAFEQCNVMPPFLQHGFFSVQDGIFATRNPIPVMHKKNSHRCDPIIVPQKPQVPSDKNRPHPWLGCTQPRCLTPAECEQQGAAGHPVLVMGRTKHNFRSPRGGCVDNRKCVSPDEGAVFLMNSIPLKKSACSRLTYS